MDDRYQDATIKKGVMKMLSDKPFWWVVPSIFFGIAAFAVAVAISVSTGMQLLGYLAILIMPFHMLWINCGYKVKIETKYQTIIRYFAFDGPNDRTLPRGTPFAILGERIPRRVTDNEIISENEYYKN